MATKSKQKASKNRQASAGTKNAGASRTTTKKGGGEKKSAAKSATQSAAKKSSAKKSATNQLQEQPQSPMPAQHQAKPGLESELTPRPEFRAPLYRGAGKLQDKAALITGGDSGIGRAVAVLYAREGADVAIVYLPEEQSDAEETRRAVETEGRRALLIPGDVKRVEFCREAVERTVAEFGKLDILVNNAAFQQHQKSLDEV
ncbi:MAG TPA: SDR family NAD(P)-dependent oxidoreductase, partial [Pyrinomonadaceae bacterium]|nr:SDR family NAD(P)-dependent oxidoreductase [Pyrinomonadaceae bacterium]